MKLHPGHDELNALDISTQAEQTIGLKVCRIELKPYQRSIIVPAMIVERPGRSVVRVTAPLGGIVTSIAVVQGEAITAGQALITVRLTHEELVQAQSDLLRSLAELDVVQRELKRLEPLAQDALIAKKTLLEREYEQQKLAAVVKAQRQALSLHGLNEEQIESIVADRELFRELTVAAPMHAGTRADDSGADKEGKRASGEQLWQVQELAVELGQHVEAGNLLCVLADHAELYIEGTAFEQDARQIERAVRDNAAVTAVIESDATDAERVPRLHILYVADKVDALSRAFHFYVLLPNTLAHSSSNGNGPRFISWRFKPGQRLKLKVPVETWPKSIVLPVEAVVQDGPESFVFQRFGDHFDRRPVRVEYRDPYSVVIANDGALKLGDVVAASGAEQLQLALKNKAGSPVDPHAGHHHE
ncbi:MAG TPA: efflux RND transporter periplasmic adaptor subunit [Pirellulales bacterium]|nr:efflux RND transporter periplasmic adaptor subunit [Pirellulales bacterium]